MPKAYEPLPNDDAESGDDPLGSFTIDDFEAEESNHNHSLNEEHEEEDRGFPTSMHPLELAGGPQNYDDEEEADGEIPTDDPAVAMLFSWRHPWLPSVIITFALVTPTLIGFMLYFYELFGRIWVSTLFAIHLWISFVFARCHLILDEDSKQKIRCRYWTTSVGFVLDLVLFGWVYPMILNSLINGFFVDYDGTDIVEWQGTKRKAHVLQSTGLAIVILRFGLVALSFLARYHLCRYRFVPRMLRSCITAPWMNRQSAVNTKYCIQTMLVWIVYLTIILCTAVVVWCLYSAADHLLTWPAPEPSSKADCDFLDETECAFPFPSFHHMRTDETSATGWRVQLQGNVLPPLKGGIPMHMDFLNELDGFPTMGPMLFYMEGLKEAHEAGLKQLQGPNNIADSITDQSVTLLVEVGSASTNLVPHSAEIDYLDPNHPLVMVFPAKPLKHGTHYALAVVNAKNTFGKRLNRTQGMTRLMTSEKLQNSPRRLRYERVVIPALESVADWVSAVDDPESVQLLFDFVTISEESQLGPMRKVRDGVLAQIQTSSWNWSDHVRSVRIDNFSCEKPKDRLARTIHAEMDVPWFLKTGGRNSTLDPDAVKAGQPDRIGVVKFVAHIPCSVRADALGLVGGKPVSAFVEYGHGLFFTREEAADHYLLKMAHEEGYLLIAQDWRGMSAFDLLIVAKILMAKPRMFEAIRDNMIQGYASKFALQDFARNAMLSMKWFHFKGKTTTGTVTPSESPVSVFYGVSQGGILGAGYSGLSGRTGLIDRAILTAAGTPFAMIMTRSLQFAGYDKILLTNFYNNRHVRLFLILVQMGWDSCEASGVLAPPLNEPFPPTLLQAGLGDPVVPTIATEALARSMDATIFSDSPRVSIFGVPPVGSEVTFGPHAMLSELQYDAEYASLPKDDTPPKDNAIHWCIRLDEAIIRQLKVFIKSGEIVDLCKNGASCHRQNSTCW